MQNAALGGSQAVSSLRSEVYAKVEAEKTYYAKSRRHAVDASDRLLEQKLGLLLSEEAAEFAVRHGQPQAGPGFTDDMISYMEDVIAAWKDELRDGEELLDGAKAALESGHREIQDADSRLTTLQQKLQALGAARTRWQLGQFLAKYAKDIREHLDTLREEAKKAKEAAAAAADGSEETPEGLGNDV